MNCGLCGDIVMAAISRESILEVLRSVRDPGLNRDIVSLNFVRDLEVDGSTVDRKSTRLNSSHV